MNTARVSKQMELVLELRLCLILAVLC